MLPDRMMATNMTCLKCFARWAPIFCFAIPATASAQAWVGPEHSLSVAIGYAFQYSDTVYEGDLAGEGVPTNVMGIHFGVEYVPIENLVVRAALPLMLTQYNGPQTGTDPTQILAHGRYDDGSIHAALTDLSVAVGYQLLDAPVAFTPYIKGTLPVTKYETEGYAAAGLGLKRLTFGFDTGIRDFLITGTYAQIGYSYSIVERDRKGGADTSHFDLSRSEAGANLGYFIIESVRVGARVDFLFVHDGFQLKDYDTSPITVQNNHDPILQQKALIPGIEAAWAFTSSMEVIVQGGILVWGDNVGNAKIAQLALAWTPITGD
jgi:hypothetical protein